jgi:hypothetical protein
MMGLQSKSLTSLQSSIGLVDETRLKASWQNSFGLPLLFFVLVNLSATPSLAITELPSCENADEHTWSKWISGIGGVNDYVTFYRAQVWRLDPGVFTFLDCASGVGFSVLNDDNILPLRNWIGREVGSTRAPELIDAFGNSNRHITFEGLIQTLSGIGFQVENVQYSGDCACETGTQSGLSQ